MRSRVLVSVIGVPVIVVVIFWAPVWVLAIALALFIAFFPYASGVTASTKWLSAMQWFKGWLYY